MPKPPHNIADAHYFALPSQGNMYSLTKLCMAEGVNKVLVASLKRKVFSFEYIETGGYLKPTVKEIPFTYIPSGAEIISIDAFNKAPPSNDFVIGITIIKVNDPRVTLGSGVEQTTETYLNIYSEWEPSPEFNLDSVAQSCLSLELQFIPYQLYHTTLPPPAGSQQEVVWLLSGSDEKVHMYREDRLNHCYQEADIALGFPEFTSLPSIALWMDVCYIDNMKRRVTAVGCENGAIVLQLVDTAKLEVLSTYKRCYEGAISSVRLFSLNSPLTMQDLPQAWKQKVSETKRVEKERCEQIHLLVTNAVQPSAVYMNVAEEGLKNFHGLAESGRYDAVNCSCIADIDMDGKPELLLGTYGQEVLTYKYCPVEKKDVNQPDYKAHTDWALFRQNSLSNPIFSLAYVDITGDGVGELIALTLKGVHILQHNLEEVAKILQERLDKLELKEES